MDTYLTTNLIYLPAITVVLLLSSVTSLQSSVIRLHIPAHLRFVLLSQHTKITVIIQLSHPQTI